MSEPDEDRCPLNHLASEETTSEVGSPRAQPRPEIVQPTRLDEDLLRKMFELQNKNMLSLIEALKPSTSGSNITLPEFNPEKPDADARGWCNTVDLCFGEKPLQGGPLIIAISGALRGSASQWLSQVSFPGMQWSQFRDLFTARYDSVDTPAATLMNLQSSRPKENECLSVYAARLLTTLTSKWQNMSMEEIAVSTVLTHLTQFDERLQRLAFTSEIVTRDHLQRELKATTFMKRKLPPAAEENRSEPKQFKTGPPIECFHCGKPGHRAIECRSKGKRPTVMTSPSPASNLQSSVVCFRCGGTGHFSSKCPRGPGANGGRTHSANAPSSSAAQLRDRQVNVCSVSGPRGQLMNNSESFLFCFDSGAECSLIKESIANKFSGKRMNNVVKLTGIGQHSVYSTLQILCQVTIGDYCLEILLHVVPDDYLNDDIFVGREILSQGFNVSVSSNSVVLSCCKNISACEKSVESSKLHRY